MFSLISCIVSPTKPNSTTGQYSRINRASDVPPPVVSLQSTPAISFIEVVNRSESSPGSVKKLSPEHLYLISRVALVSSLCLVTSESIFFVSDKHEC